MKFPHWIIILVLLFSACQQAYIRKQTRGFKQHPSGNFWYQWHGQSADASKPLTGDEVRIDYAMYKEKEELISSWGYDKPTLVEIPEEAKDNFFTQALRLMAENDSLVIKVQATKARSLLGKFEQLFEDEDFVTFRYKLYNIKPKAVLQQELVRNKTILDSIQQSISNAIQSQSIDYWDKLEYTENGLGFHIQEQGQGLKAVPGQSASVHYICFNDKGEVVDNSYSNMIPLDFQIGTPLLIDGFSQGICLLNEGGRILLKIPPQLAYGSAGVEGSIAPNATVYFFIELIALY